MRTLAYIGYVLGGGLLGLYFAPQIEGILTGLTVGMVFVCLDYVIRE